MKVIFIVQLKNRMAGAYIFGIIISKFGYKYEFNLVILFKIDKDYKIGFDSAVLFFCLVICLELKGGKKPLFDIQEIIKQ